MAADSTRGLPLLGTEEACEISPTPLVDQALWGLLGYLLRIQILRLNVGVSDNEYLLLR